jgi:hypothetical protein
MFTASQGDNNWINIMQNCLQTIHHFILICTIL